MGGDQELRRGQQSMQGDVLIPEMGAGKYWYVDPRAGLAQQPAQLGQQATTTYDPMADERSNQAQLEMWDKQPAHGNHLAPEEIQDMLRRLGIVPEGTQPSL